MLDKFMNYFFNTIQQKDAVWDSYGVLKKGILTYYGFWTQSLFTANLAWIGHTHSDWFTFTALTGPFAGNGKFGQVISNERKSSHKDSSLLPVKIVVIKSTLVVEALLELILSLLNGCVPHSTMPKR